MRSKRDNKLWNERVIPCLNEMYLGSDNVFGEKFSFEDILKYCPKPKNDGKYEGMILSAFYLSMEDYRKILDKHTKNFRYYWRFPYRSEIYKQGEEFEQLKKDYEANPENEELKKEYNWTVECARRDKLWKEYRSQLEALWVSREKNEITLKELHKGETELAKKYDCQRRSRDKEAVEFTVMNYSPNSNKEYVELVKKYFGSHEPYTPVENEKSYWNEHAFVDAQVAKEFFNNYKNNKTNAD